MSTRKPTVTKRSDGLWCSTLQVNGQRKYIYGKSEKEVREKVATLQRQVILAGDLPKCGRRNVGDLLDALLTSVAPTLKPRTLADYQAICDRHIRPHLGTVMLSKFGPEHVQALYTRLQAGSAKRAASHTHAVLHRACHIGVLWGWLLTNPCDRVIKPSYTPRDKEIWTMEQLQGFLAGTSNHWLYPVWGLAAATGCRLGEILALRWADVDWSEGAIEIRRNVQRINRARVYSEPKTKAGRRRIQLPDYGLGLLRQQRAQQAELRLRLGSSWPDWDLAFTGLSGGPLDHSTVEQAMKREIQRLGLPVLTPHGLRHLAASLLLAKGLPVTAVSARLGHASPNITMTIYAHAMKHQDRQAAEIMEAALG